MIRAPQQLARGQAGSVLHHLSGRLVEIETTQSAAYDQSKSPYYGDFMNPVQCRMARAALGWGVLELAKAAGVSTQTVVRFERGEALKQSTIAGLRATFEAAGIDFIAENGGGPGVRLSPHSKS